MPDNAIPEELVTLLHAVAGDQRLSAWLLGLPQVPLGTREGALLRMASQMRSDGVDSAVADAVAALAQPGWYEAACRTLRELDS